MHGYIWPKILSVTCVLKLDLLFMVFSTSFRFYYLFVSQNVANYLDSFISLFVLLLLRQALKFKIWFFITYSCLLFCIIYYYFETFLKFILREPLLLIFMNYILYLFIFYQPIPVKPSDPGPDNLSSYKCTLKLSLLLFLYF